PAISMIALIAGAELFGLWGALFASPIAGVVQALTVAFWREWKAANPNQFPTGSTVSYDLAVVPVATGDALSAADSPGSTAGSENTRDEPDTDTSIATPKA
ncbi:MAG TPA: hypothetical protein VFN11_02220, partial [Ktedonobacterales bacterium]|nr:hypothetical protein [Ktedonobacterales bacterium]